MSTVFFCKDPLESGNLFELAGLSKLIKPDTSIALKIHFGEPGNNAYLKPDEVKPVCEKIKSLGGRPFYTDCNTLYRGPRSNTADHLKVAEDHGYTLDQAGAAAKIPAEEDLFETEVKLKHFKKVFLGGEALRADSLIALTHFKGHELTGFGGALKNFGMGLATRRGKLKQHQDCADCNELKTCRKNQTIEACWVGSPELVQEKIVEYAYGVINKLACGYVNYLIRVSPACDCYGYNDPPIVSDLGVLASFDPVAIDQASVDLINQFEPKNDKFRALYPEVDWEVQLKYAEKLGLGSRKYELVIK